MLTSDSLLYPSTISIGYAAWLKHFAGRLPEYAARYEFTAAEVAKVQTMAIEFTNWLIQCIEHATQVALWQRSSALVPGRGEAPELAAPSKLYLLNQAALLAQRIRSHAAYSVTDGCVLDLAAAPLLHGVQRRPGPQLQLTLPLCSQEPLQLTWAQQRDTTLELEVSRHGDDWQALLPTNSRPLLDTYPQPFSPTQWQYRARYCWPDWPASDWSDVVTAWVGFGPQCN